jgi:hypothetical protein
LSKKTPVSPCQQLSGISQNRTHPYLRPDLSREIFVKHFNTAIEIGTSFGEAFVNIIL